jgi:hypothetical protein
MKYGQEPAEVEQGNAETQEGEAEDERVSALNQGDGRRYQGAITPLFQQALQRRRREPHLSGGKVQTEIP